MQCKGKPEPTLFSQPTRQILTMLLVTALVLAGALVLHRMLQDILRTNPFLNGVIVGVFVLGVVTCFLQVYTLVQSVNWIEGFARHDPGAVDAVPPTLLAPLAQMLRSRSNARSHISSTAARSILDSVATRIDEARDITRYLTNTLVFLGLLGTFFGLATTVPAVVETIRSLAPAQGETGLDVFARLMGGLESQLGGMGTAFSSSLLGLAGSMVIGLLELFASHGQNRFFRELEDWLSTITRIGLVSNEGEADGEGGGHGLGGVVEQLSSQVEILQEMFVQAEANRDALERSLTGLTEAVARLAGQSATGGITQALERVAAGQAEIVAAMKETGAGGVDAESRMRLRSIDVQLLRLLEEMAAGRQEGVAELKAEIAQVSATLRQISRRG